MTAPAASALGAAMRRPVQVAIALGSNLGDRVSHLRGAIAALATGGEGGGGGGPFTRVLRWSNLYESAPMYKTDQGAFLNAAVLVETNLPPHVLLTLIKRIEADAGRDFGGERYGPRVVDLDIATYGDRRLWTHRLEVPHERLHERDFVLAPLNDLRLGSLPEQQRGDLFRPFAARATASARDASRAQSPFLWEAEECEALGRVAHAWQRAGGELRGVGGAGLRRVVPLGGVMWAHEEQPLVMGVLNLTPDSFSDGGKPPSHGVAAALAHAHALADRGASVIDIGGQSTRPGAERVSPDEEAARILPAVKVRARPTGQPCPRARARPRMRSC